VSCGTFSFAAISCAIRREAELRAPDGAENPGRALCEGARRKAVYVFSSREAFEAMIAGSWHVGGDADAGAKYEGQGVGAGAAITSDELAAPVTVYQFTDNGVSLSAVATGTRYYRDSELN
jgi:hypothetical protein